MVKVKYPIFQEASLYTNIPFWKEMLEQCALAKFPKGMSVSKNVIYINNTKTKKNIKRYDIPEEAHEVCELCKKIFTEILGLKSAQDKSQDLEDFRTTQKKFKTKEFTSFKDASLKVQRQELIDNYVLKVGEEKGLTSKEMKKFKNAIFVGIHMKTITDIEFDDNEILDIPDITLKKTKTGWVPRFVE
jgi:hypothetical protein